MRKSNIVIPGLFEVSEPILTVFEDPFIVEKGFPPEYYINRWQMAVLGKFQGANFKVDEEFRNLLPDMDAKKVGYDTLRMGLYLAQREELYSSPYSAHYPISLVERSLISANVRPADITELIIFASEIPEIVIKRGVAALGSKNLDGDNGSIPSYTNDSTFQMTMRPLPFAVASHSYVAGKTQPVYFLVIFPS